MKILLIDLSVLAGKRNRASIFLISLSFNKSIMLLEYPVIRVWVVLSHPMAAMPVSCKPFTLLHRSILFSSLSTENKLKAVAHQILSEVGTTWMAFDHGKCSLHCPIAGACALAVSIRKSRKKVH